MGTGQRTVGIVALAPASAGGINQYSETVVRALASTASGRTDVRLVVFVRPGDIRFEGLKNIEIRPLIGPGGPRQYVYRACVALGLRVRSAIHPADEPMLRDVDLFLCPFISTYPHLFTSKPFLVTLHDLQERYFPEYFSLRQRWSRARNNRSLIKAAAMVLCEAQSVADDIVRFFGVDQRRIAVIPAPPPLDGWLKQESVTELTSGALPELYFFYPAHYWRHKNHVRLLEAFARIAKVNTNLSLVFTGTPHEAFPEVKAKIEALELSDRVRIMGFLKYAELKGIYEKALALVMPSLFESISIPIYEAFATRTPVLASRICGIPDQVGDAALLFDPLNVDDIVKSMERIIADKDLRARLVEGGSQRLAERTLNEFGVRLWQQIGS